MHLELDPSAADTKDNEQTRKTPSLNRATPPSSCLPSVVYSTKGKPHGIKGTAKEHLLQGNAEGARTAALPWSALLGRKQMLPMGPACSLLTSGRRTRYDASSVFSPIYHKVTKALRAACQ